MTDGFTCTDKDTLVAYVYGECDPAERQLVESHLAACQACADEVQGFRGVRTTLAEWVPPERAAGFRIVPEEVADAKVIPVATVLRPRQWWQAPLPALARVAAGLLLFAGGAAVANLEVRYDQDGLTVRTGWMRPAPVPASATPVVPVTAASTPAAPWRVDLASLERRLRDDFDQRLVTAGPGPAPAAARPVDDRVILARVQELIDQSEQRTQREMAYRISELGGEVTAQRLADLRKVQQGLGQTGAEALQQRQLINYLLTVSQKK